jgi:cytochrome c
MKKIIEPQKKFRAPLAAFAGAILMLAFTLPNAFAEAPKEVAMADKPVVETKKPSEPLESLQKKAQIERGRKMVLNKCVDCHTLDEDGPNRYGPNLFGIVGAKFGHKKDYAYSKAMLAEAAKGRVWSEKELDNWLERPTKYIPGTKMLIGFITEDDKREDVIAYLKTLK